MDVEWVQGQYKEDNRIFDSEFEAEEWADGLFPDFNIEITNRVNVGYATPDKKVIDYLSELIPGWAKLNDVEVDIHRETEEIGEKTFYKIWTTQSQSSR